MDRDEDRKELDEEKLAENAMQNNKSYPINSSKDEDRVNSTGSKPELSSTEPSEKRDNIQRDGNDEQEEKMPEAPAGENRDNSIEGRQSDDKLHSEDEVILFDPQSYMREMQLVNESEVGTHKRKTECKRTCMKKRNLIALLSFFGFFNVYCLRVDLSITLVAMTNTHTRINLKGEEYIADPEFDWDAKLQGHILGAFFYGYLITQIPGGYIAAKFGGKNLFGFAILLTSLLTLLTPWASRQHVVLLIVLRFLEGICEGCIYPCMYAIWSRWAPPHERAKLSTVPHAGSYAGSVCGTLVSGILCELAGWSFVFYLFGMLLLFIYFSPFLPELFSSSSFHPPVIDTKWKELSFPDGVMAFLIEATGTFGIMWSIIWFVIVVDSPENDPHITEKERIYIDDSLKDDHVSRKIHKPPWLKFMTSVPFIAILVAHTCEGWGFSTMQTCLPKYLTEALDLRISIAGVYSAILYLMMGIVVLSGGQLADILRQRSILSITNVRKLFTCTGFLLQALAFTVSINIPNIHIGVIILVVGGGIEGLAWAGFAVNHLDIAPRYASILFGITNTSATIPGILSPLLVGYLTGNKRKSEWHLVFYIGAATFAVGATFYGLFASAQKQPWADDDHDAVKNLNQLETEDGTQ